MPGYSSQRDTVKYSTTSGVVFLFNLIVGTGALALPSSIQKSGILIGILLVLILALFSFITVTFIVEALADGNAVSKKAYQDQISTTDGEVSAEETPLVPQCEQQENDAFEISEKFEIGQLGVIMTPKWCQILIYFCLCIYLYGDLTIYETVIGRTGAYIFCTFNANSTKIDYISDSIPCWRDSSLTRKNFYCIVIVIFITLLGPFVFFNLQKTTSLQITTVIMRWMAFFIMIIWNLNRLAEFGAKGHPPLLDPASLPTLFGTLVYSFMCQHSIPGLLQPISNKKHLPKIIVIDYALVACFYIALSATTIYAFEAVEDILTLNYWEITSSSESFNFLRFLAYYLAFFPIFTLSTSFPIISITLRNNLRCMILKNTPPVWYYDKLIFPLLTIIPPTAVALVVTDLQFLVGIVGSYAGACIQYLIPCLLVYFGRKKTQDFRTANKHASCFKNKLWIYVVSIWMLICLVLITINYVINYKR